MPKSTVIVRKIDDLGKLCIPKELRREMDIKEGDGVEIFTNGDKILLKKYEPACSFCGGLDDEMINHMGKRICYKCACTLTNAAAV